MILKTTGMWGAEVRGLLPAEKTPQNRRQPRKTFTSRLFYIERRGTFVSYRKAICQRLLMILYHRDLLMLPWRDLALPIPLYTQRAHWTIVGKAMDCNGNGSQKRLHTSNPFGLVIVYLFVNLCLIHSSQSNLLISKPLELLSDRCCKLFV